MAVPRAPVLVTGVTDPSQAEAVVEDVYLPNHLDVAPRRGRLDMSLAVLDLDGLTVGRLGYGQDVRLETEDAVHFHVNAPVAGWADSKEGPSETITTRWGQAAVFSPGEPADIHWSEDCVQLCLMVPRGDLETELEQLLGRSVLRLRFDFRMDLSGPTARSWVDTLLLLARELEAGPTVLLHPHAGRHLRTLLLDGLLLGQPHTYTEQIEGQTRPGSSAAVAEAVDLIQERSDEPWSTTSLAREVHLSVGALQEGFSRDVGKPPMQCLRDARLHRVHRGLQDAAPGSTTVEAEAMRWGLLHLGRFAAGYRAAFGESPSATLAP